MNRQAVRILVALFLILMGVVALLDNLSIFPFGIDIGQWFGMGIFGLGGVVFLAVYATNTRENWWASIPGFTLLGLAGLIGIPWLQGDLGGAFFLGMISLSFWMTYFTHREFWWAIIPGGVLLTLALVAGVSSSPMSNGLEIGGFFFLGLALTFLVVYLLPTPDGRQLWAIWPASILGAFGALLTLGSPGLARFIWPVALIVFGGFLIFHTLRQRAQ